MCDFERDRDRGSFHCTLEQYCDALAAVAASSSTYTCKGDVSEAYSITREAYTCLDRGTGWVRANQRICYLEADVTEFEGLEALRRTASYDFEVGWKFNYVPQVALCPGNSNKQCECSAEINGRGCASCSVCFGGLPTQKAYFYDLDCTNLGSGLTRGCDEDEPWSVFFQKVDSFVASKEPQSSPSVLSATRGQNSESQFPLVSVVAGVGVPLVVLLLGTLVWFVMNRSSQLHRRPGPVPICSAVPVGSVVAVLDGHDDESVDRITQRVERRACNRPAPIIAQVEVVSPKFLEYKHQVNPM